jgi:hypothetical protein
MSSPEFPFTDEARMTSRFVTTLKLAAVQLKLPEIKWASSDDSHTFIAKPIEIEENTHGIDITELGEVPLYTYDQISNMWEVYRLEAQEDRSVVVDMFHIGAGIPLMSRTVSISENVNDPELADEEIRKINESLKMQVDFGLSHASIQDYANLDDGLQELTKIAEEAFRERMEAEAERRRSMTDEELAEERRRKKIEKFQKIIFSDVEHSKTEGSCWWLISEDVLLYAVKAYTPFEAAAILDEYHEDNHGTNILPIFFINKNEPEHEGGFDKEFEGKEVVRLIPFSRVPWPDDMENMTSEQREALNKLQ